MPNDSDGNSVDSFVLEVYLRELSTQCQFAMRAVGQVNTALSADSDDVPQQTAHGEVFRGLHSFLTHASNVSKLLWPTSPWKRDDESEEEYERRREHMKQRARKLREMLDVEEGEEHPLKDRQLRNHLDHYDERLDHWATTSERRNLVSDMIGPPDAIKGIEASDRMRTFDPGEGEFIFRGEHHDIQELATAVERLHSRAEEEQEVRQPGGRRSRN